MTTEPPCPDCSVGVGAPHLDGCDVAVCIFTGQRRERCGGWYDHPPHLDCGLDVWTGVLR
jgi:hypothetical protein